jgi:thiol-disulfide isomerase/thioredoxin
VSRPRLAALPAAAALVLALAGCSGGLGQQAGADAGARAGYVSGDGSISTYPPDQRTGPVAITGEATDGTVLDLADLRGEVVVLNFWYAGCAPCRAEADDLAVVAEARAADGVRFVGVNTRDELANAVAFERTFATPYPSVLDAGSGEAVVALAGVVSPQSVPATIVLDRQGRPAARVLGALDAGNVATFDALIDDVLAERA